MAAAVLFTRDDGRRSLRVEAQHRRPPLRSRRGGGGCERERRLRRRGLRVGPTIKARLDHAAPRARRRMLQMRVAAAVRLAGRRAHRAADAARTDHGCTISSSTGTAAGSGMIGRAHDYMNTVA